MKAIRGCLAALVVLVILVVGAGGAAWWWLRAAPSWYAPPDRNDPQVLALAETVEKRVVEEVHRIRPPDADEEVDPAWTLRVRDEQLNAWLAARLPEWLEREASFSWPAALDVPQAHFAPEGIDIAIPLTSGPLADRVVVARVRPEIADRGMSMRLERLGLGRASLGRAPVEALGGLLDALPSDALDAEARDALTKLLSGETAVEPVLTLSDGRTVRMLDLTLGDGAVDITCSTRAPRSR